MKEKKTKPFTFSELDMISWFLAHNRQAFIKCCQNFEDYSEKEVDAIIAKASSLCCQSALNSRRAA
jgi:hypothetical protein